jgi:hypothetical protein
LHSHIACTIVVLFGVVRFGAHHADRLVQRRAGASRVALHCKPRHVVTVHCECVIACVIAKMILYSCFMLGYGHLRVLWVAVDDNICEAVERLLDVVVGHCANDVLNRV